ncbi:phage antirepressor KilAC domain-containing protein [Geofilum rhodophaeum]|uniref:phage antirepressor KilAC domain-containing protein n=1 Tax=Geofilum rhodophaeum TaxID=1965019 RepID=UPI000B5231A2|nr:phage antirepressor KilAC domain-containing protein [Geofilum rhodophaeum]
MKTHNVNPPHVFNYQGNNITFLSDKDLMVNATEMLRSFPSKRMSDFTNSQSTHAFCEALYRKTGIPVLEVTHGGRSAGTWMHQKLALKFAAWLSPDFELWVYDRIEELLKHGATALNPESLLDPDYVIKVMTALKEERAEKELAQSQVREMAPKALFADAVSTSSRSCLIGELAKILKQNGVEIGQNRLFEWLRSHGYLGVRGEYRNLPTQRAIEMGLFEIKKTTINKPDGTVLVSNTTKVTGKGQIYFVNKFLHGRTKTIPVSE